jgi:hypothetical protein
MLWLSCNYTFMIWLSYACCCFSALGQRWLASTQSSRRGRPKTTTGGLLLPRATPLLLPRAMRWEAPAAVTPLLLPRATRWQTPATIAPLLLPHICRRWEAQPSPHRSSSLVPGGGFIRRLGGDVGGGSSSSTSTGGSSDTPNGSSSDISWGVVLRLPLGLLGLQRWVPPC